VLRDVLHGPTGAPTRPAPLIGSQRVEQIERTGVLGAQGSDGGSGHDALLFLVTTRPRQWCVLDQ
jgi:hypothetical protein